MSPLLQQLPIEVRKKIFDLCTKPELINMAVCSWFWHDEVVPIVWREVAVKPQQLQLQQLQQLQQLLEKGIDIATTNLRHTRKIWFNDKTQQPGYQSFAFASIIKNCDPRRLRSLRISSHIEPDSLQLIAEKLPNLQSLELWSLVDSVRTDLSSQLSQFQLLETITMYRCSVTDREIEGICQLKNLRVLKLSDSRPMTKVTSKSFNYISHLTELKELELSLYMEADSFQLNRTIPKLRQLARLEIRHSHIDVDFFKLVQRSSPALEFLDIGMSRFSGRVLPTIFKLSNLKQLNLSYCREFSNEDFATIHQLHKLERLNLTRSTISDKGARHVSKLLTLRSLDLSDCEMLTDIGLQFLSQLTLLDNLQLGNNSNYTAEGIGHLSSLRNLQILRITKVNVTDRSLLYLSKLCNLRKFVMAWCPKLTDDGLLNLTSLRYLKKFLCFGCDGVTLEGMKKAGFHSDDSCKRCWYCYDSEKSSS